MRRLLTPLAVALAAAIALPAGAASAASVRVDDATGDVRTATTNDSGDVTSETDTPGAKPDVSSITVTHAKRAVSVQIATTGLVSPTGDQLLGAVLRFEGKNKQRRVLQVIAAESRPGGRSNLMIRESNGKRVCKKAVKSRIDYAAGTVTAVVPRHCLGNPKQVRVAGVAFTTTAADAGATTFDDVVRQGGSSDTAAETYTPFVKRG